MEETFPPPAAAATPTDRQYLLERIGEAAVVQVYADGFDDLPLREKTLIWHLGQAAIAGRDIYYDQRYAHSLEMRDVLEAILTHSAGVDRTTLDEITVYTKLFWINTGPYNNLTSRKFVLVSTPAAFAAAAHVAARNGATFPLRDGESLDALLERLRPMFFDVAVDPTVTSKTPRPGKDIVTASANNLYVGVTLEDLDRFEEKHPLNSRVVRRDGRLVEEVYRIGGRYSAQIAQIVRHLEAAIPFATEPMGGAPRAVVAFFHNGGENGREGFEIPWGAGK